MKTKRKVSEVLIVKLRGMGISKSEENPEAEDRYLEALIETYPIDIEPVSILKKYLRSKYAILRILAACIIVKHQRDEYLHESREILLTEMRKNETCYGARASYCCYIAGCNKLLSVANETRLLEDADTFSAKVECIYYLTKMYPESKRAIGVLRKIVQVENDEVIRNVAWEALRQIDK